MPQSYKHIMGLIFKRTADSFKNKTRCTQNTEVKGTTQVDCGYLEAKKISALVLVACALTSTRMKEPDYASTQILCILQKH